MSEFQVVIKIFCYTGAFEIINILFMMDIIDIDWQKAGTRHEKGEEEKHAVSVVTSSYLIKK